MNAAAKTFLSARWVHLVMLNYEVEPSVLLPFVPNGTELDFHQGKTFVSLVGFRMLDTRVCGIPIPFHRNFEEVNLRFYVRATESNEIRRGVVFVKEIVPRRAIAWVARRLYNENYVATKMHHQDEIGQSDSPLIAYEWNSGSRTNRLAIRAIGSPFLPAKDSEEEFISEHYWGYVRQRSGATVEYNVLHPQWRVWQGKEPEFECDVTGQYGESWIPIFSRTPSSSFIAEGSAVTVSRGRLLRSV